MAPLGQAMVVLLLRTARRARLAGMVVAGPNRTTPRPVCMALGAENRTALAGESNMVWGEEKDTVLGEVSRTAPDEEKHMVPDEGKRTARRPAGTNTRMLLVLPDIDQLLITLPPRPGVLSSHDIKREDWDKFTTDLAYAWSGEMGQQLRRPRRSHLVVEIVETWNLEFFMKRGVEAILYKGRERRTGELEHGTISDEEEEEEEDYDSDSSDDDTDYSERAYTARGRYTYNPGDAWRYEEGARGVLDRFRARRDKRQTKKRELNRLGRNRQRTRATPERLWSLYFRSIPPRSPRYHGRALV
ncbi:hypothetical protein CALVIDRAFT_538587 [Calocera viscosa TUFC12733]|uniref:Uncharacterized protein n=1 Tax=Calocera viscosa (strain TUFC12733) TaxID=1330018 RepID=A0A167KMH7_CALVF|nr:hypothetical protein CALVIDRAFT_538587 [Calocera viscosa TUFC12733]